MPLGIIAVLGMLALSGLMGFRQHEIDKRVQAQMEERYQTGPCRLNDCGKDPSGH